LRLKFACHPEYCELCLTNIWGKEAAPMLRSLLLLLSGVLLSLAQDAPDGSRLLVVNLKEHSVLAVDPVSGKTIQTIPVGVSGHEIALSADKRFAYVPIYSDAVLGDAGNDGRTIDVIDLRTLKVTESIDLGRTLRPHQAVFGPDGLLYVTAELANAVEVVDTQKRAVVGEIPTGKPQTHAIAVSPDGLRAYTANVDSGTVSVLDLRSRKLIALIPVATRIQRIAISSDGRWVFTCDWDKPREAVIDTKALAVSRWIDLKGVPFSNKLTPDGRWLLVSETRDDKGLLEVVDLQTMQAVRSFVLDAQPFGFLIHDDRAYMSCLTQGKIEILNLHNWTLEKPITMTWGVDGMAWLDGIQK
jgi:YVTN family beta-propeller protein